MQTQAIPVNLVPQATDMDDETVVFQSVTEIVILYLENPSSHYNLHFAVRVAIGRKNLLSHMPLCPDLSALVGR